MNYISNGYIFDKEQEKQCSKSYLEYITYVYPKAMPLCDIGYTSVVYIVRMYITHRC